MKGGRSRNLDLTGAALPLWQQRDPPWVHVLLGLGLIALLSWADMAIGRRVSLDYFYILPVILAAWRGNRDVGLFLVFAGGLSWFACEWPFGTQAELVVPPELASSALAEQLKPDPLFRVWEATMLTGFLAVVCLLTCRLRETFERERSQARTDALTGLANRRTFCERLEHEIERMQRTKRPFTLAVIDLDNFKYVNDHFGHQTGDEVLQVISKHMLAQLRSTDLPGRIGGDEFALLLPETDATGARTCLMDLLSELTYEMGERGWPVGCSIGAVTFRVVVDTVNAALHMADEQMYAAKRAGKGRLEQLVYFGPGSEKSLASGEGNGLSAEERVYGEGERPDTKPAASAQSQVAGKKAAPADSRAQPAPGKAKIVTGKTGRLEKGRPGEP